MNEQSAPAVSPEQPDMDERHVILGTLVAMAIESEKDPLLKAAMPRVLRSVVDQCPEVGAVVERQQALGAECASKAVDNLAELIRNKAQGA